MNAGEKAEAKYSLNSTLSYWTDKTKIGLKHFKGDDNQEYDIACYKATIADEVVPKEKHVVKLKMACSAHAPRGQVHYIINKLAKRMTLKDSWLITLKSLMVYHRLMREVDASFLDELLRFQERLGIHHLLRLDNYSDHATRETWDYSAWIRVYSAYLDERLEAWRLLKFDPEHEVAERDGGLSLKTCDTPALLERLPKLQKLLRCMLACLPEGAAALNAIVCHAAVWVLRESRAIYRVVSEGIINLADRFFEMERPDAVRALEMYKENVLLNEKLNGYFGQIQEHPGLRGTIQVPTLQALPSDFLSTMEDYVRDMPKTIDMSNGGRRPVTTALVVQPGPATSAAVAGAGGSSTASSSAVPSPAAAPPKKADLDLLSFDDLTVSEPPAKPGQNGQAAAPAAPAAAPRDPLAFLDFGGAPVAPVAPPQAHGADHFGDSAAWGRPAPFGEQTQQPAFDAGNPFTSPAPAAPYAAQPTGAAGANPFGSPAPQQPAYGAQQTGYGGYAQQQTGYAPQVTGGYAPQMTGSPANPFGNPYVPATQQAANPFGATYAPQAAGYAQQATGAYAPQQTAYAPQQTGYGQQHTGYAPQQAAAANPFGGAPAFGAPAANPFGAAPIPNGVGTAGRLASDPLNSLTTDLFAKPAPPPAQPVRPPAGVNPGMNRF